MDALTSRLPILKQIPDTILRLSSREVRQIFPEPCLIEIEGASSQTVFLSVLLHGNETTGFSVLQRLARWLRDHRLPRTLLIFVGNVHAAEAGLRHLTDQPDFNRIWNGGSTPEHALAQSVLAELRSRDLFAAIDIHNNTGRNPLYGCINSLTPQFLHLASLFSPTLVYFRNPPSVISMALSELCPAVTVESGRPGEPAGIERAFDLVHDTLHLSRFRTAGHDRELTVYRTVGRMEIEPGWRIGFSPSSDAPLRFPAEMDSWNFSPKQAGTHWADLARAGRPLRVLDEQRLDLTDQFFTYENGALVLSRDATPSMITLETAIIQDDCFGYLMEEIDLASQHGIRAEI